MTGYFHGGFSAVHARMNAASISMKGHSEEKRRENVRKSGWNVTSSAEIAPAAVPPQLRAIRKIVHASSVAVSAVKTAVPPVVPSGFARSPPATPMNGVRNTSGMSRVRGAS